MNVTSDSPKETAAIAATLAREVGMKPPATRGALVFALTGELGAGKTAFVQSFAKTLGVKKSVTSPTFLLLRRYRIRGGKKTNLFHIDAYRIRGARDLANIGAEKLIAKKENIVFIEWAEKVKPLLPKDAIWIRFKNGKKSHERIISFTS